MNKINAICPNNPEHKRFTTTAHITQSWVVDEEGRFIDADSDLEVTHGPDKDNIWTCYECGEEAIVREVFWWVNHIGSRVKSRVLFYFLYIFFNFRQVVTSDYNYVFSYFSYNELRSKIRSKSYKVKRRRKSKNRRTQYKMLS